MFCFKKNVGNAFDKHIWNCAVSIVPICLSYIFVIIWENTNTDSLFSCQKIMILISYFKSWYEIPRLTHHCKRSHFQSTTISKESKYFWTEMFTKDHLNCFWVASYVRLIQEKWIILSGKSIENRLTKLSFI